MAARCFLNGLSIVGKFWHEIGHVTLSWTGPITAMSSDQKSTIDICQLYWWIGVNRLLLIFSLQTRFIKGFLSYHIITANEKKSRTVVKFITSVIKCQSRWLFRSGWFHFIAGEKSGFKTNSSLWSFVSSRYCMSLLGKDMQRVDIPFVVCWGIGKARWTTRGTSSYIMIIGLDMTFKESANHFWSHTTLPDNYYKIRIFCSKIVITKKNSRTKRKLRVN